MILRPAYAAGCGLLLAVVFISGCASRGPVINTGIASLPPRTELNDTAFFPQQRYHCGPAALATVLRHARVEVTPDDLKDLVYIPGRRGALQAEMLAAVARHRRLAYLLPPDFNALLTELAAGRPVLVLQNLGLSEIPAWHYAVLVGYDTADDSVTLRSGTTRRLRMSARRFLGTWQRSGKWAFVVLPLDAVPTVPDRQRWLTSIAALERITPPQDLAIAYATYLSRFPKDSTGTLGLANARLAQGRAGEAEGMYRELLARQPNHVPARNNLALSLSAQHRTDEALAEVERALRYTNESDEFYQRALADTRRRISGMGRGPAVPATR